MITIIEYLHHINYCVRCCLVTLLKDGDWTWCSWHIDVIHDDDIFLLGDHTGADDQQRRKSNQGFCFARTTPSGFFLDLNFMNTILLVKCSQCFIHSWWSHIGKGCEGLSEVLGDPAEQGGGGGGGDAELQVHPSDIYVSPPLSSCSSFKNPNNKEIGETMTWYVDDILLIVTDDNNSRDWRDKGLPVDERHVLLLPVQSTSSTIATRCSFSQNDNDDRKHYKSTSAV